MGKKKIPTPTPEETKLMIETEVKDNIQKTFCLSGSEDDENGISKDYTSYETQKLILMETLHIDNIKDMTNLNDDEIEDLENALMVNMIFNNPLIERVCYDHMKLKRSLTNNPRSLLQHLFDWSTRNTPDVSSFNPIAKVLGKKGAN